MGVGPAQRVDWRTHLDRSRQQLARVDGGGPPDDAEQTYQALRQWRQRRARAADVPAHVVFSDQTLRAIAKARPTTKARLASMPGMRPVKLQRYGDDLLDLLAERG